MSRRLWTTEEEATLREAMAAGGYAAAQAALPHRSLKALRSKAHLLGLTNPPGQPWSEHERAQLRRAFDNPLRHGEIKQLARRMGRSTRALYQMAVSMGLSRINPVTREWSQDELELLRKTANMSMREASQAFETAGFYRPKSAIEAARRAHGHLREDQELLTVAEVAQLLGISESAVRSYVRDGYLRRKDNKNLFSRANIRFFVRRHPTRINLRRISPGWQLLFIDIVAGGLLAPDGRAAA